MMENIKNSFIKLVGELLDRRDLNELSSEERIERMEQIDEQIETLTEIIGELVKTYEELEEEERQYQENKRKFKNKVHDVRSMFSNKKKDTEEDAESYFLELSYEISDKMNALRAKTRRSAMEEEALIMLTKQLEEVTAKLVNNK